MPTDPKAGEVWFADLGMAEKSRPVLVLAMPGDDDARSLVVRYLAFKIQHLSFRKSGDATWPPDSGY